MRDTLYLQLRDQPADGLLAYALTGADETLGLKVEQAPLDQVLGLAAGRRIVLFVPGSDVRLTTANVPARNLQKILQAVPYALEDQLAEDVETLHFAVTLDPQRRRAADEHPVAIVARARMDAWLAPLLERGLRPDAVVPETLCLPPPEPDHWTAYAEADRVTVRTGYYTGFACALSDLAMVLQVADPEHLIPLRLSVGREVEHDFTALGRPLELLPGHQSALEVFVKGYRPERAINLLQGAYSGRENWRRLAQPWRVALAVAVAWAVLAFGLQSLQAVRLGAELKKQDADNIARYQQLFPEETRIVDLAAQAQQQLAQLRGGGGRAPMFQLLGALSAALAANNGLTLQSIQFREGAMFLGLTGTDLSALEGLRTWFASHREAALEVQSANAGVSGVQIRLKLTPA